MKHLYIKIASAAALMVLLILQGIWLSGLYRSSESNCRKAIDQCLTNAADIELNMRLISLGEGFQARVIPYTDTSTYVTKKIQTEDTLFYIRINRNDPTVFPKVDQYILNDFLPVDVPQLDILFRRCMAEHSLNVKDSYIEHWDLKKNRLISSDAPEKRSTSYLESSVLTLDIINTIGVKAYVHIPVFDVLRPFMLRLMILAVLTLAELGLLCWLLCLLVRRYKDRLKFLGFIKKMSHDIKKPLNASTIKIDDLSEQLTTGNFEQAMESADRVSAELNKISFYVEEVLAIINEEEHPALFAKENIALPAYFNELKERYEQNTDKKVSIKVSAKENSFLYANKVHFENVVEALLNNSVTFSNDPVNIQLRTFTEGMHSAVVVIDDGWGIPEADHEKVFYKFYCVKSHKARLPHPGFGLGLTYVKAVVRAMGGEVFLESEENSGTEIILLFNNDPREDMYSEFFQKLGEVRLFRTRDHIRLYFALMFSRYNWLLVDLRVECPEGVVDNPYDPSIIYITARPEDPSKIYTVPFFAFEYYYDVRFVMGEKGLSTFMLTKEKDPYLAERRNAAYAKGLQQRNRTGKD